MKFAAVNKNGEKYEHLHGNDGKEERMGIGISETDDKTTGTVFSRGNKLKH